MKPELLIQVERGGFPEKFHYGFIEVIDNKYNVLHKIGEDKDTPLPFRSAAKPMQATMVIDSGAYKEFDFDEEELAVICASHSGTKMHADKVLGILKKIGLDESYLQCGAHMPLDVEESKRLIREGLEPTPLNNNCSGKHAGMLSVCVKNGWDTATYLDTKHPLQIAIMKKIRDFCILPDVPPTALDGCSAPVPILPHHNMAIGFLNIFLDERYKMLKNAILKHPDYLGGPHRIDSEVMKVANGKLIAKIAAEGLCFVMNVEKEQVILVKITDAEQKARSVAIIESIKKLGWLTDDMINSSENLKELTSREIINSAGNLAGCIKAVFEFE